MTPLPMAPAEVRDPGDVMICARLHCVLTASICLARQQTARTPRNFAGTKLRRVDLGRVCLSYQLVGCAACPDGTVVEQALVGGTR